MSRTPFNAETPGRRKNRDKSLLSRRLRVSALSIFFLRVELR